MSRDLYSQLAVVWLCHEPSAVVAVPRRAGRRRRRIATDGAGDSGRLLSAVPTGRRVRALRPDDSARTNTRTNTGGWITFNYSWRWIFFINLPVGAAALALVIRVVEDPPYIARLKAAGVKMDYIGIALLALGVGALQIMLDKGQEDDWFGSHLIVTLAIVAAVCLVSLVVWEWFQTAPIIDVRLFRNVNYLSANVMISIAA